MGFRVWLSGMLLLAASASGLAQDAATDADKVQCPPALARFLPGDFNYCLAERAWHRANYRYALEMFELSAGWGSKSAQQLLGVVHFNGERTTQNRPLGLAWLALASERGEARRRAMFLSAWQQASPAERKEADRLYLELRAVYGDEVAATRAERRFTRELRRFRSNPVFGSGTCLAGTMAAWGKMQESYQTDGDSPPGSNAGCNLIDEDLVVRSLEYKRDELLRGWQGKVDVGPLEPVKRP